MKLIARVCLIPFVVSCTGCVTIASQADYWGGALDTPIYGGMQGHVQAYYEGELAHRPWWFFVPDLPFSLVADTAILPLTLGQTLAALAGLSPSATTGLPTPTVPTESDEPADDKIDWPEPLRF